MAANRAGPILRQLLKGDFAVVNIAADFADPFFPFAAAGAVPVTLKALKASIVLDFMSF
jgi:hypothetical protein